MSTWSFHELNDDASPEEEHQLARLNLSTAEMYLQAAERRLVRAAQSDDPEREIEETAIKRRFDRMMKMERAWRREMRRLDLELDPQ